MSLVQALKNATSSAHRRAESRDLQRQLVQGKLDELLLSRYLIQLRCLHFETERLLDAHEDLAAPMGWSDAGRHSRRLDADLRALEVAPGALDQPVPRTQQLLHEMAETVSREPVALLGYCYVLEGSMNGNRFVVRALRRTPAAARCAFSYFDPYGDDQPVCWTTFKASLDRLAPNLGPEPVIEAALSMFAGISEISDEVMACAPAV